MSYIGNTPGVSSQRIVDTFIATAGQTTFTTSSGYTPGYVDVYYNGVKLVAGDDFTAATGSTIVLASGAALGDSVEIVAYLPRGLSDGYLKSEADSRFLSSTDGSVTTAKLAANAVTTAKITDANVTAAKLASGAAVSNIGYTPVNKAGDTLTGTLKVQDNLATFRRALNDQWVLGVSAPDANDGVEVSLGTQSGGSYNTVSVCSGGKKTIAGDKDGHVTTYGYLKANGGLRSPNDGTVVGADSAMPTTNASMIYTLGNGPGANDGHIIGMSWNSTSVYGAQMWLDTDPTFLMAMRQRNNAGAWNPWSYIHNTNTFKVYTVSTSGATSSSGTRASITLTLNSSTNKLLFLGSDLLRTTSGYQRGELRMDGSAIEGEFMYQEANNNKWQTTTGIAQLTNVAAGSHTFTIYADLTYASGAGWDSPTYFQIIVWDGAY